MVDFRIQMDNQDSICGVLLPSLCFRQNGQSALLGQKNTNKARETRFRKGIDLVNDNPENNLMREVDTIKSCQDKMRKTLEQVNHQLGMNRNSRHQLERDLANKDQAISIGRVNQIAYF